MKILMICTEKLPVPPVLGGAIQTYIAGILPLISKAHDITVLGINHPTLPDTETIDGVHYARIAGGTFDNYQKEVVRYLQSNQFDLIHIFNRPRLVLPVRSAAPHSKINLSMHNDMFSPEKIKPEEASAVIEEVSKIVTISKYVGNVIRDLYPQAAPKLRAIYSGVDSDRFLPGRHPKMQSIRNQLRKEHGLENKTVILFSGRLSYNKGVDRLVRALPALSKRFKDLALVIVGSKWFSQNEITDYIAYVQALARKLPVPVVATGFVSPSEIQKWYAAADLFVCTSIWQEPLARVHYEAMAAGLPIVTTARGGNAEVILVGENGLIVEEPENPAGFEEKITEILSNKALMAKMGQKGRELAISLYNWERVASEVLEVWEQSEHTSNERDPQENIAALVEEHNPSAYDGAEQKLENENDEMNEDKDKYNSKVRSEKEELSDKKQYKSKVRSEKETSDKRQYKSKVRTKKEISDKDQFDYKKNKDKDKTKYKKYMFKDTSEPNNKSQKDVIIDTVKSILDNQDLFKSIEQSQKDVMDYTHQSDRHDNDSYKSIERPQKDRLGYKDQSDNQTNKEQSKSKRQSRKYVLNIKNRSDIQRNEAESKPNRPSRKYALRPTDQYLSMIHSRKNQ